MADEAVQGLGSLSLHEPLQAALPQYRYHPLKGRSSIRLLELQPATTEGPDELVGQLVEVNLCDNPVYAAISYTWGDPIFSQALQLPSGHLMITENLASALRRFRSLDASRPVRLWADQVCINQSDTPERSQQVSIMGEIYMKAKRALMWLGPGDEGTTAAVMTLKEIASSADRFGVHEIEDGVIYSYPSARSSEDEDKALEGLATTTNFWTLRAFFALPWFSRMWISQEVSLPPTVDFFCGIDQISFDEFAIATAVISKISQTPIIRSPFPLYSMIYQAIDLIGLRYIRVKQGKVKLPAPDQTHQVDPAAKAKSETSKLTETPRSQSWRPAWNDSKLLDYVTTLGGKNLCSDDRDRIYALISLCADDDVNIEPDYRKNVGQVYADFARQCLARHDVRILHYAGLALRRMTSDAAQGSDPNTLELPSWAPDWRVPREIQFGGGNKQNFTASTGLNVFVRMDDKNPCVDIAGAFIDVIEFGRNISIGGFLTSQPLDYTFETTLKSILSLKEFFDKHVTSEKYPNGEAALTAFARTVATDLVPNGVAPLKSLLKDPQNAQEMVNLWLLFEKIGIKVDGSLDLDAAACLPDPNSPTPYSRQHTVYLAWTYMTGLSALLKDRKFFVTHKKYIGLAPAMANPGDVITLIGGCQTPFVLRADHEKRIFRLIGECYLHGFMKGELLTDAFPRFTFTIY